MSDKLTSLEARLINLAWDAAPRFRTRDQYESYLRGFRMGSDGPALKAAFVDLLKTYEAFYS